MADFDSKSFLQTVNSLPGVYRMLDQKQQVLYVGKAKNLKKRLSSYFRKSGLSTKTRSMVGHINSIVVINTRTESEALLLENDLIKNFKPRYNILFRDDKSYPYINLTRHKYPRLVKFRGKVDKKKGQYFGPFPSAAGVNYTINHLQGVFQLRSCENSVFKNRSRACLQYQIQRCTGPCVGLVSEQDYQEQIRQAEMFLKGENEALINDQVELMEQASAKLDFELAATYRNKIERLRKINQQQFVTGFNKDLDILACVVEQDYCCIQLFMIRKGTSLGNKPFLNRVKLDAEPAGLLEAFIMQHYSRHPIPAEIIVSETLPNRALLEHALSEIAISKIRLTDKVREKRKQALENAIVNAQQALQTHLISASNLNLRYQSLIEELKLKYNPQRIECFDISHSSGEATKASCVVFGEQGAIKSDYRCYNINDITAGDDYAAMRQVLMRRYEKRKHQAELIPDVILIDGGKGQLSVALEVSAQLDLLSTKPDLRIFAIAKGPDRKAGYESILDESSQPLNIKMASPALLLIQQIRDEAHRFAITGHRKARAKKRNTSRLEEIPGIGSKRRKLLLNKFGGLQGVIAAGIDEMCQIKGINRETAQQIYDTLHG